MLTNKIIAKIFNGKSDIMGKKIKYCTIFTDDSKKAELKILELYNKFNKNEIRCFTNTEERKEFVLNNGWDYFWVKLDGGRRCYRFGKAIIDRNATPEQLHQIIMPKSYTANKNDIELF